MFFIIFFQFFLQLCVSTFLSYDRAFNIENDKSGRNWGRAPLIENAGQL